MRGFWVLLALGLVVGPTAAASQVGRAPQPIEVSKLPVRPARDITPLPWGPGERLEYRVKLGVFNVGGGFIQVNAVDTIRGHQAYHTVMQIEGGLPFAKVRDRFESWIDVEDLYAHRFIKDQHEVTYKRYQDLEFRPDLGVFRNTASGWEGPLETERPLDDLSFIYFVRSLPLEVGDVHYINRYYTSDGNPVRIEVVGTDTVEVPAGTFETLVIRPSARTEGLFAEGGEAEIHLSNDPRRLLVYMRTKVPVIGSMTLSLTDVREGRPLDRGFYTLTDQDLWPDSVPVPGLVGKDPAAEAQGEEPPFLPGPPRP